MATEGSVGDWSGTYLARSGVNVGATAAGYAAFSLLMIIGRIVGDGIVGAAGPRATVALGALLAGAGLAISAAWPGLAGGVIGFGLVGAGLANVVPVLFSVAGRVGSSPAVGVASAATAGYAGLLIGPVVIGAVASAVGLRSTIVMLAGVALISAVFASSKAGGLAGGGEGAAMKFANQAKRRRIEVQTSIGLVAFGRPKLQVDQPEVSGVHAKAKDFSSGARDTGSAFSHASRTNPNHRCASRACP